MKNKKENKKVKIKVLICIFVLLFNFSFIGCNANKNIPMPDDPKFAPVIPDMAARKDPEKGSLFVSDSSFLLYQDIKANKVGDIITVILVEATKAKKDAKTNLRRSNDLSSNVTALFGGVPKFSMDPVPFVNSKKNKNIFNNNADIRNNFSGGSDSNQNNYLRGSISVTVSKVLPNSNLVIKGEKWITLNQGSEYIRLTGIVRPSDITANNEVLSTRIANARISYSGTGDLAKANRVGWLTKFFNSVVWPF